MRATVACTFPLANSRAACLRRCSSASKSRRGRIGLCMNALYMPTYTLSLYYARFSRSGDLNFGYVPVLAALRDVGMGDGHPSHLPAVYCAGVRTRPVQLCDDCCGHRVCSVAE